MKAKILEFLKKQKYVLLALLVGAILGAIGGYRNAPVETKIVEKEKKVEVIKEVQVSKQEINVAEIQKMWEKYFSSLQKTKTKHVIQKPDGTKITDVTEVTNQTNGGSKGSETDVKASGKTEEIKTKEIVKIEYKDRIVEVKAPVKKWYVSGSAGYSLVTLWGNEGFNLVPVRGLVVGAEVGRSWGSVDVGVTGNSQSVLGLALRLRFGD